MSPLRTRRGVFIGRVRGIELFLDPSWFLIAALVTFTLASDFFPSVVPDHTTRYYYALGLCGSLLFFLSILLHELGHSVVSQRCGIPVPRITLMFIGGLAEISREPDDARSELKIALGGPAVSLVLVGIFYGLAELLDRFDIAGPAQVFLWLSVTNLALAVFNMIPGYPLDGGRVLRAILWARSGRLRRATYITSRIGIGFAWVLIALGVSLLLMPPHPWNALVFVLIGTFLKTAAQQGYDLAIQREVLDGIQVGDVMTRAPVTIPDHLPLSRAVDEVFLLNHLVAFPVCTSEGHFCGMLRLAALKSIPRERWPYTSVAEVIAIGDSSSLRIEMRRPAAAAMRELSAPGRSILAVLDDERVVGVVTRRDLQQFVEIRNALE